MNTIHQHFNNNENAAPKAAKKLTKIANLFQKMRPYIKHTLINLTKNYTPYVFYISNNDYEI